MAAEGGIGHHQSGRHRVALGGGSGTGRLEVALGAQGGDRIQGGATLSLSSIFILTSPRAVAYDRGAVDF